MQTDPPLPLPPCPYCQGIRATYPVSRGGSRISINGCLLFVLSQVRVSYVHSSDCDILRRWFGLQTWVGGRAIERIVTTISGAVPLPRTLVRLIASLGMWTSHNINDTGNIIIRRHLP